MLHKQTPVVLNDGTTVNIDDIIAISGDMFRDTVEEGKEDKRELRR